MAWLLQVFSYSATLSFSPDPPAASFFPFEAAQTERRPTHRSPEATQVEVTDFRPYDLEVITELMEGVRSLSPGTLPSLFLFFGGVVFLDGIWSFLEGCWLWRNMN